LNNVNPRIMARTEIVVEFEPSKERR